jgi:hypothetical protein
LTGEADFFAAFPVGRLTAGRGAALAADLPGDLVTELAVDLRGAGFERGAAAGFLAEVGVGSVSVAMECSCKRRIPYKQYMSARTISHVGGSSRITGMA